MSLITSNRLRILAATVAITIGAFGQTASAHADPADSTTGLAVRCVAEAGIDDGAQACAAAEKLGEYAKAQATNAYGRKRNGAAVDVFNGRQDAMRHCLWNARMATSYQIGPRNAEIIANFYETVGTNTPEETAMDLANNARGRQIGVDIVAVDAYQGVPGYESDHKILNACRTGAESGQLHILNKSEREGWHGPS